MKKKVRIYKAPDGKGKFVNKTAKFLRKAQEGGQQDQQAQIANYVYKTLDDAEPFEFDYVKESLIDELAAAKVPIEQAEDIVENIASNLQSESAKAQQLAGDEEQDVYDQGLEELKAQEEAAAAAEEERQAALAEQYGYYDDTAGEGEDDEDDDDEDDIPESVYMQNGGDVIPEDNPVSFTGYDPIQYTRDKQQSFSHGGMTKRKYVGKVMQLLRKQEGGEDKQPSQMDPTDTADNKKKNLNKGFIDALANTAREAKMKEKAEAMWEQQQQQMMQQQLPQYPMQAPMEQIPMAQYGMSVRQMRRMMPRGFGRGQMRSFAGMVPPGGFFPMGMNIMTYPQMQMPEQKPIHVQGTMPGMKLDVRKSHWLTGRPSQYSLEFGGDFAIPGFNMMPGAGYGTKSTQRRKIEGVSKLVNKIADPANDIKKNEPSFDKDRNNVPDNIQSNAIAPTTTTPTQYDKNGNGILDVTEVATNLPGVTTTSATTNPNKDAVGKGAKVPTKTATNKTVTASKSKQVGQTKQATPTSISNKGKATVTPVEQESHADIIEEPTSELSNFLAPFKRGFAEALKNYKPTPEAPTFHSRLGNYQQTGGFVDSSNPDLYKFVYGGDDAITQQDMNYSDSKNTGSPYFRLGGLKQYGPGDEVKEDDYDKYLREKAESEALDEYNAYMNRAEKDSKKFVKYNANTNDAIYNRILKQSKSKYNLADPNENSSSGFRAKNPTSEINPKTGKQWTWEEWDAPGGGGYEARQKEDAEWKRREQEESNNQGNTYNPYGGYGGYRYPQNAFGRYFPANTIRRLGTWTQQQGMPYDPRTGAGYFGGFGPNTQLSKIDVRKSGWLSGRPKKYTMYFNNYSVDPKLSEFLEKNQGATQTQTGTRGAGWGEEDLRTRKDRRQARRYDRLMNQINSGYAPSEDEETEEVTQDLAKSTDTQKSAEDQKYNTLYPKGTTSDSGISSIFEPEETEPNSYTSEKATEKYNTLYPEGTTSTTGIDSIFEPEVTEPNSYQGQMDQMAEAQQEVEAEEDADQNITYESPEAANEYIQGEWGDIMGDITEVLGEEVNTEFNEFLKQNPTKGEIDSKIEELMGERNAAIGRDQEASERGNLMASPEQQILNQNRMQANPMFMGRGPVANQGEDDQNMFPYYEQDQNFQSSMVPGFGDDMSGVPMMNGVVDPWSLPDATFPSDNSAELASRPGAPPFAESIFPPTDIDDPLAGYGWVDKDGKAYKKQQSDLFARKKAEDSKKLAQQQRTTATNQELLRKQFLNNTKNKLTQTFNMPNLKGENLQSFVESTKAPQLYQQIVDYAKALSMDEIKQLGIAPKSGYAGLLKLADMYGWGDFIRAYQKDLDSGGKNRNYNYGLDTKTRNELSESRKRGLIKQFGGASNLGKFVYGDEVTKTSTGKESPVSNLNNPINPFLKYDESGKLIIPGFGNQDDNKKKNEMKLSYYEGYGEGDDFSAAPAGSTLTTDAEGNEVVISPDEARKRIAENEFAVDFKNKNTYEVDAQGMLLSGNALARGLFGALDRRSSRKQNKDFYDRFTADNLYASDPSRDRGDYDVNTGLYRPNEQGQIWNSRSARYGGYMQEGGQRPSFYDTAVGEYKQWLSNPAAWQEDPEMLGPDGKSLNLCLDCMNMDWNNEQDIRDAHRLVEEGYSTGTHRNEDAFNTGLKKYGLETPKYASKKALVQNQFGGVAAYGEGDVVDMTPEEIEEYIANGGEVEIIS